MTVVHKELAGGRWSALSFAMQMAHVGGEVERALNWRERGDATHTGRAYERALELLELTILCSRTLSRTRELARLREALVDFFAGKNEFESSARLWRKYFGAFTFAARRHC